MGISISANCSSCNKDISKDLDIYCEKCAVEYWEDLMVALKAFLEDQNEYTLMLLNKHMTALEV